jgi:TonB family protein
MKTRLLPFVLGATLATNAAFGVSAGPSPVEGIVPVTRYVEPIYPLALTFETVYEGFAEVGFVVGPDGKLQEIFIREYSHPAFATEVERTLKEWEFQPLEAGQPQLPRRYLLRFNFLRQGVVSISGPQLDSMINGLSALSVINTVRVCKLRDLDRIPDLVTLVVPQYPAAMKEKRTAGSAVISFYIDETGTVRIAGIAESSQPEFALAALEAVRQWKFAPPTRRQRPVRVFAVQEFIFTADSPTAQGKMRKEDAP